MLIGWLRKGTLTLGIILGAGALGAEPSLIGKIVPFQVGPELGAHARGLLAQHNIAGVCQIGHTQGVAQVLPASSDWCRNDETNTYTFNLGFSSPIAVYFVSQ